MPGHDDRIDIKVFLTPAQASMLDKERHRLSMEDPDGYRYSRADVIAALIELHMARRQLCEYVELDERILRGDRDELLPRTS